MIFNGYCRNMYAFMVEATLKFKKKLGTKNRLDSIEMQLYTDNSSIKYTISLFMLLLKELKYRV